MVKLVTGCREI